MPALFGTCKPKTLLTARLFEPIDKSLSIDYLKAHTVTDFPELYRPVRERGFLGFMRDVVRKRKNHSVTTAWCEFVAAQLITETSTFGDFKYHQTGTGATAENVTDTGMQTPTGTLARDVGTQVQGASAVGYKSVATTTFAGTHAVTEHGLFNTAGTGGPPPTGGTLMDRSVIGALNVVSGNQIQWTYEITITAGG